MESQTIKLGIAEIDLSEIFTVRNIYTEKAKNYILRQGHAQFGAGGLGHDVIRAMHMYGAVSEMVYSGIPLGKTFHQSTRQKLFENLTTQDDHLMHLIGTERSKGGKIFFLVKNSWGEVGPYKGLIHVSRAYFAINTISLVVPEAALDSAQKLKLGLK